MRKTYDVLKNVAGKIYSNVCMLVFALVLMMSVNSINAKAQSNSFKDAQEIALDQEYTQTIGDSEETWFKLYLKETSQIAFNATYDSGQWVIYDSKLKSVYKGDSDDVRTGEVWSLNSVLVLKKGTYYFNFYANEPSNTTKFSVTDMTEMVRLGEPKITKVQRKTGIVQGKTSKKVSVYVKYGKKTYSAKSDKKGKFKVKVKNLKKGKTLKVWVKSKDGIKGRVLDYKVK